jgi:hypothetical protein
MLTPSSSFFHWHTRGFVCGWCSSCKSCHMSPSTYVRTGTYRCQGVVRIYRQARYRPSRSPATRPGCHASSVVLVLNQRSVRDGAAWNLRHRNVVITHHAPNIRHHATHRTPHHASPKLFSHFCHTRSLPPHKAIQMRQLANPPTSPESNE